MILKSTRDPNTANATQREVDELMSYLEDEGEGLSLDQIACTGDPAGNKTPRTESLVAPPTSRDGIESW
jgi:hypothetical protein